MSTIMNGLFAGRAGIQAHGSAISVLADNIANSNTVGFKASRADFVDLLAGNLATGAHSATSVGSGSAVQRVTQIFDQGTFEFTNRGLDLGIDGNGFFVVEDDLGSRYFTRAGNFQVDAEGSLLNQNGYQVMGFPEGGTGSLAALNVNDVSQQSVATTSLAIAGNLDASAVAFTGILDASSFTQLEEDSSFSTTVDIFDTLGTTHPVTVFYFKNGSNSWTARAYVDGADVGAASGVPALLGAADLTFSSSGAKTNDETLTIDPLGGGSYTGWSSGADDTVSVEVTFDPYTQFTGNSSVSSISQNGTGGGSVVSFNVEKDGTLFALLDNGQTSAVGKLGLASFANPEGLKRQGESLFTNSSASGSPVYGTPDTGQFGGIQAGALELSTADIAGDFIKMISLQRGFQGSSRIITSINDLLQEVMNLAR